MRWLKISDSSSYQIFMFTCSVFFINSIFLGKNGWYLFFIQQIAIFFLLFFEFYSTLTECLFLSLSVCLYFPFSTYIRPIGAKNISPFDLDENMSYDFIAMKMWFDSLFINLDSPNENNDEEEQQKTQIT